MSLSGFLGDFLPYLVARALTAVMLLMPLPAQAPLWRAFGWLAYYALPKERRRALNTLEVALGTEWRVARRERTAHRMFMHFAEAIPEMIHARRLLQRRTWRRFITVHDEAMVREALSFPQGAIYATAHLGHWELLGFITGLMGRPLHSLYRPLGRPWLDGFSHTLRELHGSRLVPASGAIRRLMRELQQGHFLGLLLDQWAKTGGVYVDYFGLPALTPGLLGLLAVRTGAPVMLGFMIRCGRGFHYELFVEPLPATPLTGDFERDMTAVTQAYMATVEKYIRRFPEQYVWAHKRWHSGDIAHATQLDLWPRSSGRTSSPVRGGSE